MPSQPSTLHSRPTVSVIIPAFNCGRYLGPAIQSVLKQTHPADEIIVVDDGSTDNTAQIAGSFSDRIRCFRQANAGPAAARNTGARNATGEWLAFLDADDEWLPWRLEIQLQFAAKYPEIVLWCAETIPLTDQGRSDILVLIPPSDLSQVTTQFLSLKDFAIGNPVGTTTVLLQRAAFLQAGGFDQQFRGPEDYDLWMRIAAVGRIAKAPVAVARYRDQVGSLSMDDRKFLPQVLRVLDKTYGTGGVLHGRDCKSAAKSYQYAGAAWMAHCRQARFKAVYLILQALFFWPLPLTVAGRPKGWRVRMLMRYLWAVAIRPADCQ